MSGLNSGLWQKLLLTSAIHAQFKWGGGDFCKLSSDRCGSCSCLSLCPSPVHSLVSSALFTFYTTIIETEITLATNRGHVWSATLIARIRNWLSHINSTAPPNNHFKILIWPTFMAYKWWSSDALPKRKLKFKALSMYNVTAIIYFDGFIVIFRRCFKYRGCDTVIFICSRSDGTHTHRINVFVPYITRILKTGYCK